MCVCVCVCVKHFGMANIKQSDKDKQVLCKKTYVHL